MNIDIKKLVQTKFLAFAMKAFASLNKGRKLGHDKYLKHLAGALTRVAAGETKRLVISMPPRHGKTFMASICLSAWILAHNSSAKIIVLSYGQDLADKIAYTIRNILRSEWYEQAFNTQIKKDRAKLMDFVTTGGGGVRSLSIEGGVTGLGADYIIIDDPVEIKDCDNTKRLERVNDLFDNEIQTRLDHPKKGCIAVIAHRISEIDLPGHVLQKGGWRQLKLPLIAPRRRKYDLGDGEVWNRKKGELSSDIKPQNGMEIVVITPSGDKVERLRKYRRIIRDGLVQLPQNAPWSHEFLNEATQFPYGPFDDQMDALSQYLNWVTEHPHPNKRPPRAIAQGVGSGGRVMDSSGHGQGTEIPGGVLRPRGRMMSNGPFQQPNVTVKY
jgi:hypothetical protein